MAAWKVAILGLLALALSADIAAARKFRIPHFIPIPGMSSGGIVKVLELPDTLLLQRPDGRYLDLGYRFTSGGSGEWVGYVGSSSEYLPLSDEGLKGLMIVAGLKELPPAPARGSGPSTWLMLGLGLAVLFGLKLLKGAFFAAGGWMGSRSAGHGSQRPDWVSRAEQRIEDGDFAAAPAAPTRRPSVFPRPIPQAAAVASRRAAFGRRG